MPDESETLGEFVKRNFDEIKDLNVHELRKFMDGNGWNDVGTKGIFTVIRCHKETGYLDEVPNDTKWMGLQCPECEAIDGFLEMETDKIFCNHCKYSADIGEFGGVSEEMVSEGDNGV